MNFSNSAGYPDVNLTLTDKSQQAQMNLINLTGGYSASNAATAAFANDSLGGI
jgi:hypothetical protein